MWQNAHPRALALWTGSPYEGTCLRHVFDLNVPLAELMSRDDFGEFCTWVEYNVGVLDALGTGRGEDAYEGFGTDVEQDQVDELIGHFERFLSEKGLLALKHEAAPANDVP